MKNSCRAAAEVMQSSCGAAAELLPNCCRNSCGMAVRAPLPTAAMAAPRAHEFPGPQRGAKRAFTAAFFRLGMGDLSSFISETPLRVWFSSNFRRLYQTRLWWDFS